MAEPSLQLLGEQIARIQAELRDLRGVRSDVAHLRAEVTDRTEAINQRIDNLERSIDNLERGNDARFDQLGQQMTTNLEIMLATIKAQK